MEGYLLYSIVLVSAKDQHESAIGVLMSSPSSASLPPPAPPTLGCYRAPVWVPWVIGYLFYIW